MEVIERQFLVKTRAGAVDPLQQSTIHFNGKIILVRDVSQSKSAIDALVADGARQYGVGMDMEWQPTFSPNLPEPPIALIQLSTENVCVIFCMLKMNKMPVELRELLTKHDILKIGVAVDLEDRNKLLRQFGIELGRTVDICDVAVRLGFRRIGLANLASTILGAKVNKACRTSNWAAQDLSGEQIRYAATDAFLSLVLYYKLRSIEAVFIITGPGNSTIFTQNILTTDRVSTLFSEFCSLITEEKVYVDASVPSPPVKCPTCKSTFRTPRGLDAHNKTDHTPINCEMCRQSLPSVGALFEHIKATSHFPLDLAEQLLSGKTEYFCYQCPGSRSFRSITGAIQHYILKHQVIQRRTKDPSVPTTPGWMPQVTCNGYGLRSIHYTGPAGKLEVLCDSPSVALIVPGMALRDIPDPLLPLRSSMDDASPESLAMHVFLFDNARISDSEHRRSSGSSSSGEKASQIATPGDETIAPFVSLPGPLTFPSQLFLHMAANGSLASPSSRPAPANATDPAEASREASSTSAAVPEKPLAPNATEPAAQPVPPRLMPHNNNARNHFHQNQHQATATHAQHKKRMQTQPYQPARYQQYGNGRGHGYNNYNAQQNRFGNQNVQTSKYRAKRQGETESAVAQ